MATVNMQGVPATLFAPLANRAAESSRADAMLHDPRAVELYEKLSGLVRCPVQLSKMDQTFTSMRACRFDQYARDFMKLHPRAMIVDIGCGLDTRFYRLDDGHINWLGIDVPEVIDLRRQYLPDSERCQTDPGSFFELGWIDLVEQSGRPVIFLAEGVLPYFTEAEIKPALMALVSHFPGGELVFDAFTSLSVKIHNRTSHVLKESGARLQWWLDEPKSLEAWGLRLLERWSYFGAYLPRLGLGNLMKFVPPLANATVVLHYRLGR